MPSADSPLLGPPALLFPTAARVRWERRRAAPSPGRNYIDVVPRRWWPDSTAGPPREDQGLVVAEHDRSGPPRHVLGRGRPGAIRPLSGRHGLRETGARPRNAEARTDQPERGRSPDRPNNERARDE